ncbi:MAG: L-lactate dehydrogenase, partial [Phycisphaerales bacterium]
MESGQKKVVVIGAGAVGTAYIYALLPTGVAGQIVLIDKDTNRVEGEVMDLSHGLPFIPPTVIKPGSYVDCADADLIVVTAGAKQAPGQSRVELIRQNAEIVRSICTSIAEHDTSAVLVMVTNPVDALTHVALEQLNWPRHRIIGSGTVLDSARFKYLLSRHCRVDARNVHAYIIGEHGDSEVAAWSMTHIAGVPIEQYCRICGDCDYHKNHRKIAEDVRDSAYHIIDYKGATYYGIGLSLVKITQAVLRDENSILTVSTLLNGEYGIDNVCLSVPCVVGAGGVKKIITAQLSDDEHKALHASAGAIKEVTGQIAQPAHR